MKKRYVLLVLIIISVVIFNVPKSYANNKLDSVELKENNDINKEAFAMYVENGLGQYEPYTEDSNYFPNSLKYHYNEDMSKCVDNNDQEVDGILTHNEDNSVTVTSNKTVYCYLYFDLDKEKPILTEFTINEGKEYTNINPTNIKLSWSDEDINEYCINKVDNSDSCEWKTIDEIDRTNKTKTIEYTLDKGLNNLYAYIKDLASNVSNNINKNITLDTSKPGQPTVTLGSLSSIDNNYTNVKSQTVTVTYTDNDVDSYCISLNDTCTNYVTTGLDKVKKTITINNYDLGTDGSKTIKVWLKDLAGNISENPGSITKTLDTKINDIKAISTSNVTNSKVTSKTPTVTITWDDGDIDSYCISTAECSPSTKYSATNKQGTSSITLNEGANTIHAKVKDKAGNISKDKTLSVTVDTTPPTLNITGNTINETSIVLTYTASDASGITSITCDKPNGVACSCTGTTGGSCTYSNLTAGTNYNNTLKIIAKDGVNLTTTKSGNYTTKDNSASSYIEKLSPLGLNKTIQGGMYRFQGKYTDTINNYICFGTDSKNTCVADSGRYMYRIIGIVQNSTDTTVSKGMIKVIKQTPINESSGVSEFQWHTSATNASWSNSQLKKRINGASINTTTGNKGGSNLYLGSASQYNGVYPYLNPNDSNYNTWVNKMVEKQWYEGDIHYSSAPTTAEEMFNQEHGITEATNYAGKAKWKPSSTKFKVSLMNLSDYYWSVSKDGVNCNTSAATCKSSWMHISHYNFSKSEWTMSRSGRVDDTEDNSQYTAWYIFSNGAAYGNKNLNTSSSIGLRPVFYLNTNTIIKSGTGSESDPFIIQV